MAERFIGDYLLLKEIGEGSLGQAYLAEHRFLKKKYVLKVLPEELSCDRDFIHRFEAEVLLLSQLEHPHIAKICNASQVDGVYYLVTEAVLDKELPAQNLEQYFASCGYRLSEEQILKIALQLASALDFAHGLKDPVSHGCLKLSNILIQEKNGEPFAQLTDFGLSKVLGPPVVLSRTYQAVSSTLAAKSALTPRKTPEGLPPGPWSVPKTSELHYSFCQTFSFLAPEQKLADHPQSNTFKSDIYAFGVLLYYLLTGEFPEGYFDLPSKKLPDLKWNWDLFICKTLQRDPLKRPDQLTEKLEELLRLSSRPSPRPKNSPEEPKEQLALAGVATESSGAAIGAQMQAKAQTRPLLKPTELVRPSFEPDPGAIFQVETGVAPYRPEPKEEAEVQPIPTPMKVIAEGIYHRGSLHGTRDEMPRHEIHLKPFAIDTHPITNEQFVRFLEAMGGEKDGNNNDMIRLRDSRIKRSVGKVTIESGYSKHPVVGVSWYGAVAYAKWVGKRLPTEAEWEIASYGGKEESLYPTGDEIERSQANFFSSDTTPIMSYPPNGLDLYDMAGNVYEWCQDWYDFHFYDVSVQEPDNPKGPAQGVYRVLRGGCWKSSKEDTRCAHRHRNNPGVMNGTYGFRCAADVVDDE